MREITKNQMYYILGIDDNVNLQHLEVQEMIEDMHEDGFRYIDIAREMYGDMRQDYIETVKGKKPALS